jgi:hypothetical protein
LFVGIGQAFDRMRQKNKSAGLQLERTASPKAVLI